jgi:Patatin-like phospholipase
MCLPVARAAIVRAAVAVMLGLLGVAVAAVPAAQAAAPITEVSGTCAGQNAEDRILAVTAGGPVPPELGKYSELQGCDLVSYDAAPGELDGWASALDPARSHLIRETEFAADIARAARRLSGTSVGIVLSGGGARAFSHIGVLEELTAAGVTIDRVAGVSMGAVIGALFAMGHDADEIDAICFDEWVQGRPLSDYTVPRHSLIRGERFLSMLDRTFGMRLIEELPRRPVRLTEAALVAWRSRSHDDLEQGVQRSEDDNRWGSTVGLSPFPFRVRNCWTEQPARTVG